MNGLRVLLNHPQVAFRSCDDCKRWLFDEETGKIKKRKGVEIPRPEGVGTPCERCPKKSPELAHLYELSAANLKTLEIYWQCRATNGASLKHSDDLLNHNLSLIHQVIESHKDSVRTRELVQLFSVSMTKRML